MSDGRRILGNPPGSVPVHPVGSVSIRVDLDPYLGMAALADYLGLSCRTIQNRVTDPTDPLPTYRVGAKSWPAAPRWTPGWPAGATASPGRRRSWRGPMPDPS